ncbi:transposase [Curtobacterium sp. VKM Ac-1393]|uniref:transposase n=1 Tax=Curtobacterium sp. VKM Ac-1393 TaxID=2783814 RepID=UPI00188D4282|nr:transposase [Curtobacterium sp. VKM Ac-1393]MBF4608104.1 IS110 family transposase [Curtobacterium sp. VKM Ac-1393]
MDTACPAIARTAVEAAQEQKAVVIGEAAAARLVNRAARDLLRIRDELAEIEAEMDAALEGSEPARLLVSIPGFSYRLAADFLAASGADLTVFETPDWLASFAPVPRDSGKISGNHHRPRGYDRRLLNACFQATFIASRTCPTSKAFYQRKRAEGKSHKRALIALARRRINVIWAVLRDRVPFESPVEAKLAPTGDGQAELVDQQADAGAGHDRLRKQVTRDPPQQHGPDTARDFTKRHILRRPRQSHDPHDHESSARVLKVQPKHQVSVD